MDGTGNAASMLQIMLIMGIIIYLWSLLKDQKGNKTVVQRESKKEMEKLEKLRSIKLTEPLAEKTRPRKFSDIIGQEEGIKALRAALCGPNPQHVIIYGPPGVGKTAAARLVLEEAKKNELSPFTEEAKFVEIDATTARFDDRGIADPLIGSVHDPIYQGAGPLGAAGIPQPKPGAVTKAHGGILFIDEIGELHPIQINKLLKVLEDRKVFLESAYYSSEDENIPQHIHDIFQHGLPADFRLVGATTRMPQDIPPAIRSRCVEIFFRPLTPEEIGIIASNAAKKVNFPIEDKAIEVVKRYANNGRDAVNIIQIAAGVSLTNGEKTITQRIVEWVVNTGQYVPRPEKKVEPAPQIGVVNGMAVLGPNIGTLIEVEATAYPVQEGKGKFIITGVIEEEEVGGAGKKMRRKSMAKGSVENVLTNLYGLLGLDLNNYYIHVNFPGGTPIDGPSAGVTIATAIYSAIKKIPVDNRVAMTGELSIRGLVKPVGGVVAKIEAAKQAGVTKVLIPKDNYQEIFAGWEGIEIIPVESLSEVFRHALRSEEAQSYVNIPLTQVEVLSASNYN